MKKIKINKFIIFASIVLAVGFFSGTVVLAADCTSDTGAQGVCTTSSADITCPGGKGLAISGAVICPNNGRCCVDKIVGTGEKCVENKGTCVSNSIGGGSACVNGMIPVSSVNDCPTNNSCCMTTEQSEKILSQGTNTPSPSTNQTTPQGGAGAAGTVPLGLVPCGQGSDASNACTLCHLIVGVKNIIAFGQGLLITVAAFSIFVAGFLYIIAAGSEATTSAKNFLSASLMGFAIFLASWFIINLVMTLLSYNTSLAIQKENWYTFTCISQSSTAKESTTTPYPENTTPTPGGYTYDSGIEAQTRDASDTLNTMLNCMQPKLSDSAKRISSISDSAGMATCANNWNRSTCAHAKNSCHYGGTSCVGKSYAVDFGNEAQATQIMAAASQCGGRSINEGDHIHVSVGNCGCDE